MEFNMDISYWQGPPPPPGHSFNAEVKPGFVKIKFRFAEDVKSIIICKGSSSSFDN